MDDLRYRVAEMKDQRVELESALAQAREAGEGKGEAKAADGAPASSHLLHLTLVQQELAAVQAAVDERDRFITLTLTRIAAYQKAREDAQRQEAVKAAATPAAPSAGLVSKLWGGKKKALTPDQDDSMEWNGREWVKKVEGGRRLRPPASPSETQVAAALHSPLRPARPHCRRRRPPSRPHCDLSCRRRSSPRSLSRWCSPAAAEAGQRVLGGAAEDGQRPLRLLSV